MMDSEDIVFLSDSPSRALPSVLVIENDPFVVNRARSSMMAGLSPTLCRNKTDVGKTPVCLTSKICDSGGSTEQRRPQFSTPRSEPRPPRRSLFELDLSPESHRGSFSEARQSGGGKGKRSNELQNRYNSSLRESNRKDVLNLTNDDDDDDTDLTVVIPHPVRHCISAASACTASPQSSLTSPCAKSVPENNGSNDCFFVSGDVIETVDLSTDVICETPPGPLVDAFVNIVKRRDTHSDAGICDKDNVLIDRMSVSPEEVDMDPDDWTRKIKICDVRSSFESSLTEPITIADSNFADADDDCRINCEDTYFPDAQSCVASARSISNMIHCDSASELVESIEDSCPRTPSPVFPTRKNPSIIPSLKRLNPDSEQASSIPKAPRHNLDTRDVVSLPGEACSHCSDIASDTSEEMDLCTDVGPITSTGTSKRNGGGPGGHDRKKSQRHEELDVAGTLTRIVENGSGKDEEVDDCRSSVENFSCNYPKIGVSFTGKRDGKVYRVLTKPCSEDGM